MMLLPLASWPSLRDLDVGLELAGQLHELHRRPRVQAQLVPDLEPPLDLAPPLWIRLGHVRRPPLNA